MYGAAILMSQTNMVQKLQSLRSGSILNFTCAESNANEQEQ